jgi:hypothetical protein
MSEDALRAKYAAGFKGSTNHYSQPMINPSIKFVEGIAKEVLTAQKAVKIVGTTTSDPHKV